MTLAGQAQELGFATQELERRWLTAMWSGTDHDGDVDIVGRTCMARPLDALGSATLDLYAFTHDVLFVTDMGRRSAQLPRPSNEIAADAEAALAAALDADNFDLAAELLWTWPMLGLPWSSAATFGFGILASAQDREGFLPGPGWSRAEAAGIPARFQEEYVLRTSYHATFVMGFLCAAALRPGLAPPSAVPPNAASTDSLVWILPLLRGQPREPIWQGVFDQLDAARQASLAEFVLTIAMRRARATQDLELVRECISVALRCGLLAGPAVHQALALLQRATLIGQMASP